MPASITEKDLALMVIQAFENSERRVLQRPTIVRFFETCDLNETHTRKGLDFALSQGWIEAVGIANYKLTANMQNKPLGA